MAIVTTFNGIDAAKLHETMDAIAEAPALAKFEFRVENEWVGGGHNRSTVRNFRGAGQEDASREKYFVLNNDLPEVLLGNDKSATPMEFMLHALAGCLTTTLVYHATGQGVPIRSIKSQLVGKLDVRQFLGFEKKPTSSDHVQIRIALMIETDAPRDTIVELCGIAQKCSPAFSMLSQSAPISIEVNLTDVNETLG